MIAATLRWLRQVSTDKWIFAGYALVSLGLAGGSAIWLPIVMPNKSLGMDSMFSFVMVTVGPPTVDLLLRTEDPAWTKGPRMALIVVASLAMVIALSAFLQSESSTRAWNAAWVAVAAAAGCWLFANFREVGKYSDNKRVPPVPPAAVSGPDALPGTGWN